MSFFLSFLLLDRHRFWLLFSAGHAHLDDDLWGKLVCIIFKYSSGILLPTITMMSPNDTRILVNACGGFPFPKADIQDRNTNVTYPIKAAITPSAAPRFGPTRTTGVFVIILLLSLISVLDKRRSCWQFGQ